VVGFYTGISARGKNTLASLANVQIESSTRTGVAVDTNAAVLSNVTTLGNGGDGARLGGRSINASSIEAHLNGGAGVAVSGRNQRVQGRAANNSESAVSDCRHSKSNSIEVSQ
jgi:hypothetical protein